MKKVRLAITSVSITGVMLIVAAVLVSVLTGCSTLPSVGSQFMTVRTDAQLSEMTSNNNLEDENAMETFRVSSQYRNDHASLDDPNHLQGVVSQIGISYGQSDQNITLFGLGTFDFDIEQIQLDIGLRAYSNGLRELQTYVGLGFAPTWTKFDARGASSEDVIMLGGYIEVGAETAIGDHMRLGAGVRYTGGLEGEVLDEDVDLDNFAFMLIAGWTF